MEALLKDTELDKGYTGISRNIKITEELINEAQTNWTPFM